MFLKLREILFYFESEELYYFNLTDYKLYNKEERQSLINTDVSVSEDFLLLPSINGREIMIKYLVEKNNRNLLRREKVLKTYNFFHEFHWFLEDNKLKSDWGRFEETELLKFASVWCERNQINYTTK